LGICLVGAYSPRNTLFDVWVALGAGIIGYLMRKDEWPLGPLILGFILGPMLEQALRQSISMGGPTIFFSRPIAIGFLVLAVILVAISLRYIRRVPKTIVADDSDT
jgi:putative tricarboxylic transport membrane protein